MLYNKYRLNNHKCTVNVSLFCGTLQVSWGYFKITKELMLILNAKTRQGLLIFYRKSPLKPEVLR